MSAPQAVPAEITIAIESPLVPDAVALIRELDDYLISLYPPDANYLLDPATLAAAGVRFFVARRNGEAAGCAALRFDPSGFAELKRMFVRPHCRGTGIGRRLLIAVEHEARAAGMDQLLLETGIHQPEALALYRALGYTIRGPFGDYADNPLSVFMEKFLAPN
jgi:putative acetyltransferase